MRLDVLIFGPAASAVGTERVTVVVKGRPTVRTVLDALSQQHPKLRFALPSPESGRLAVNQSFATGESEITPGDEVALITLVGGG